MKPDFKAALGAMLVATLMLVAMLALNGSNQHAPPVDQTAVIQNMTETETAIPRPATDKFATSMYIASIASIASIAPSIDRSAGGDSGDISFNRSNYMTLNKYNRVAQDVAFVPLL